MNRPTILIASISTTAALLCTGCQNLTPGENAGVFGAGAAVAAGAIARATGASTSQSLIAGAAVGAAVAATVYIITKHQATVRQRQIAEQRARAAQARIDARRRNEEAAARRTGKKPAAKRARYIAVDTEKNEKTSPRAKKAVMIWDTQSQQIVGNNVYDVESTPSIGQTARFETYSAEYVGGS